MDLMKYVAGKGKGSNVVLQGETTLLVSAPGGFDSETGLPNPTVDKGFQISDILQMREDARAARDRAQAALDAAEVLVVDALKVLPKAKA